MTCSDYSDSSDGWGSDGWKRDKCGCKCITKDAPPCKDYPCKKGLPKCLKVCVKPGCYKCRELKKYECKYIPPKYELRYVRKVCQKPYIACSKVTSCCCNLAVKYNKN